MTPSKAGPPSPRRARPKTPNRSLTFDDVALLRDLCGENDRNLARIEQTLGVTLFARGDRIDIAGEADISAIAETVLRRLYDRVRQVRTLEPGPLAEGEVDGVLRLALGSEEGAPTGSVRVIRTQKRLIEPRSVNQATYMEALAQNELVFGLGPAGTGKTYLAVAHGVMLLVNREVDRLTLSRPAVEAG